MESNQKQQSASGEEQGGTPETAPLVGKTEEVAPGIPIVRTSTPKPLSFAPGETPVLPAFPAKAPSAPPLPEEEIGEGEEERTSGSIPAITLPSVPRSSMGEASEFIWLFEYGLEMDPTVLNSPQRLNGQAMLYGAAVLKGYSVIFGRLGQGNGRGQVITTIVPATLPNAEVWGILYRIPRRLAERQDNVPALLDAVHTAAAPLGLYTQQLIQVRDRYRDREIACITYVATEAVRRQLQPVSPQQSNDERQFVQRFVATARKQRLPESYVSKHAAQTAVATMAPKKEPEHQAPVTQREKDTDPLPAWRGTRDVQTMPRFMRVTVPVNTTGPWLTIFAVYLMLVLLVIFTFAILQALGFGNAVVTRAFAPMGVPWLVLVYGLLGGCISSIIALGRLRTTNPPLFVVITWFTRPYIGIVLAMVVYLALNCGVFNLGGNDEQRMSFFLLSGVLAGLCEGWLFFRRQ